MLSPGVFLDFFTKITGDIQRVWQNAPVRYTILLGIQVVQYVFSFS